MRKVGIKEASATLITDASFIRIILPPILILIDQTIGRRIVARNRFIAF